MTGNAELVDCNDIELRLQCARHFPADGHATARQREHEQTGFACVRGEFRGELATGIVPIAEAPLLQERAEGVHCPKALQIPCAKRHRERRGSGTGLAAFPSGSSIAEVTPWNTARSVS